MRAPVNCPSMSETAENPEPEVAAFKPAAGRPRDPDLERRALEATRQLYIEFGRGGVTFNAVATRSGVGKPALYRRWQSSDDMIIDALAEVAWPIVVADMGDALQEMTEFAVSVMHTFLSPQGAALLRVTSDFHQHPTLFSKFMAGVDAQLITGAHAIVTRAIDRGDLAPTASPEVIAAAVAGGAMVEVLTRLHAGDTSHDADIREFATALAELVLGQRG